MRSAIYEGVLTHERAEPSHRFRMRLALPLLDASEVDRVVAHHPLWSRERVNVVSHRRRDHFGDPSLPLDTSVRDVVETETGRRPDGPVLTLGHVRTWGWLFNPLAVHFCANAAGDVDAAVLAVTNTPWKERHAYVLDGPGHHEVDKAMHVSPFMGMDQRYRISYTPPGERLRVAIDVHEGEPRVFRAVLDLRRHDIDRAALARVVWRYPLLTMRVSAAIHHHALRLWRKGATYHPNPPEPPTGGDSCSPDRSSATRRRCCMTAR